MGDTYGSTSAYFVLSNFETTAKVVSDTYQKTLSFGANLTDDFSSVVGDWIGADNSLSITNARLYDSVIMDIDGVDYMKFIASSKQDQSNFLVEGLDKDGNIISAITIDPSTSTCEKEYFIPLTDATKVKFSFDIKYSIERYESTYKDVTLRDITLYSKSLLSNITDYTETQETATTTKVDVSFDDNSVSTIETPNQATVTKNEDDDITIENQIDDNLSVTTTLNQDGSSNENIETNIDNTINDTVLNVDLFTKDIKIDSDGGTTIVSELNGFILNLITDALGRITPNYTINGKYVIMPTFNRGSKVDVTQKDNDVMIDIETKLTTKIVFEKVEG